jgi:hypothetical protein
LRIAKRLPGEVTEEIPPMQRVTVVRYTTKPDRADENQSLVKAVFDELRGKAKQAIAYAVLRDGDEFVHLFLNLTADDSDALTDLATFKAFSKGGPDRWVAPPEVLRRSMNLLHAHGFAALSAVD